MWKTGGPGAMGERMKTLSENRSFGGTQGVYSHVSDVCGCEMTFAVYLPPQALDQALSDLLEGRFTAAG